MNHSTATSTLPLTEGLGALIAFKKNASDAALSTARDSFIDTIGVMLAARNEPVVAAACHVALEGAPKGSASVLLTQQRARASDAAMVNAVAAHALAMDDIAWGCHPSAAMVPALMAAGEQCGASGRAALVAWTVGYEVMGELAAREPGALRATGWHPVGLLGPVATAAAVCSLRGLDAATSQRALGIASSMTGGLLVNLATHTKALHAGRVAAAGLQAVDYAVAGVTASPQALERANGLLHTISPAKKVDIASGFNAKDFQERMGIEGVSLKKFPICYAVHRIVDAAVDIARRPDFDAKRVQRIEVWVGKAQLDIASHHRPATVTEAKYSVEFAVASALLAQGAGFAQLNLAFLHSEAVQRLMSLIELHVVDALRPGDPVFSPSDRVLVHTAAANFDSGPVEYELGHARRPMGPDLLRAKFLDCAAFGGIERPENAYTALSRIGDLDNLRSLIDFIPPNPSHHAN